jgi:hypothetical protein
MPAMMAITRKTKAHFSITVSLISFVSLIQ